ncbi:MULTISPECIES: hypothetical protein [unclassified Microcoleus]|nr:MULTISPECIES: hypothetical protein [unclassified Microcoleus]MCC3442863.1 hypothetical protein [Microcoleus sp. PH2017_03_ELD_O_A]MCC3468830.1 hypothetical protein [Microcoleus sp. PH2017_06_SFM_O_A]MCC3413164.1 hypothetical protein [Microcoleus sp. PH2017_02_FOX_O_A]MCC3472131.1 hypothetical protein [Microcoleus sp. PH2017_13_LAR_U_A]MCC3484678.1 hypothetical protein [Microcoleus sp. PH2017_14_LAR_D_A]
MNSLILISPYKGSGFKLILSGKTLEASKNSVAKNEAQASGFQLWLRRKT